MGRRWLVIGLIASVALNLFLVGAGAGVIALGVRMAREAPAGLRPSALMIASEGLPQPERRNFRMMLRDLRLEVKPDSDRSLAARSAAWDGLADPAPDSAAIEQKLAQSRQIDIGVRTRVEQRLVDYAVKMSPADRRTLAEGMRRQLTPRPAPPTTAPAKS
jgi:uncharacterized membrane protein